jgi:hypothetical protein
VSKFSTGSNSLSVNEKKCPRSQTQSQKRHFDAQSETTFNIVENNLPSNLQITAIAQPTQTIHLENDEINFLNHIQIYFKKIDINGKLPIAYNLIHTKC